MNENGLVLSLNKDKKLIYKTAKKYKYLIKNTSMSFEDLKQIATIGYIKAYRNFDVNYKTKFSTYAVNMMKWEISNTIRGKNTIVKFPHYFSEVWSRAYIRNVSRSDRRMVSKLRNGRNTDSQINEAMNYYGYNKYISLDSKVSDMNNRGNYYYDIVSNYDFDESAVFVNCFMEMLSIREREVVELMMLDCTQLEIANELGISVSTVARIVKKVKEKLIRYRGE